MEDATAPIMETVRRVKAVLEEQWPNAALLGFAGSPFTVACYMVEGRGSRDFAAARRMAYEAPEQFERLLAIIVEASIGYLVRQIDAGADAVMLFDSWAGILPPTQFRRHVIAPTLTMVRALRSARPGIRIIGFPRLAGYLLPLYATETDVDCVGLDTSIDLPLVREGIGSDIGVQGNLDPVCLLTGGEPLANEASRIATTLRGHPHIFNLGHGVMPETPPDHVAQLVSQVRGL